MPTIINAQGRWWSSRKKGLSGKALVGIHGRDDNSGIAHCKIVQSLAVDRYFFQTPAHPPRAHC